MSFSSEAKKELCRIEDQRCCCRKAECYGMFLFARNFALDAVGLTTENGGAARRAAQLAAETTGCVAAVSSSMSRRREGGIYTVTVEGESERLLLLRYFGYHGREISLRVNRANLENECCYASFLRGAFLSCGTVTDPQKDYHLEFIVPHKNLAKDLVKVLEDVEALDAQPNIVNRKGSYVVYNKGSEQIADFLAYIGAPNAALELMQVKMFKEVRNNVNRKMNFESANLDKTASAAAKQMIAIQKIAEKMGLDALPDDLRELAQVRLDNPEMSLRELGAALSEPISRSGVNHRLNRLLEMAQDL